MKSVFRNIIKEYDGNFGSAGLDEAFLDLTEHLEKRKMFDDQQRTFPKDVNLPTIDASDTIIFGYDAEETVKEIRHRIYLATCLTASAGIAANMRLAKLCSG